MTQITTGSTVTDAAVSTPTGTTVTFTPPMRPCPACGHCPCCGRGGYGVQPYYPPIYPQPTWAPVAPNPWSPWVVTSGTAISTVYPSGMVTGIGFQ